jgi:hypothetical protein
MITIRSPLSDPEAKVYLTIGKSYHWGSYSLKNGKQEFVPENKR